MHSGAKEITRAGARKIQTRWLWNKTAVGAAGAADCWGAETTTYWVGCNLIFQHNSQDLQGIQLISMHSGAKEITRAGARKIQTRWLWSKTAVGAAGARDCWGLRLPRIGFVAV